MEDCSMSTERTKMPPTDAQIVAAFIAEAAELEIADAPYTRGTVAARRELAARLALAKVERAEYVKDAGERLTQACAEVAKGFTAFLARANGVDEPRRDKQ
jgi:hypothetical protein